jgi:RNA polymerase sigma factor (sigma-70 family)
VKPSGRFTSAEENAYQKFFHQYIHQVSSYISRKIAKREDVKDVVQDVFIHLWEYRQVLYSGNAENIIFKTAQQKISEFYRLREKQPFYEQTDIDYADSSSDELKSKNQKEDYLNELEASIALIIPPIRMTIFKMNKIEGITQKQIAKQLNIPLRTVEYHIAEAMIFLKKRHKKS